ncbi:MAG: hypothetical protein KC609_12220 [Myxococcales bacterium]|nr:hypothetical protein [Myxococcales bacterium]
MTQSRRNVALVAVVAAFVTANSSMVTAGPLQKRTLAEEVRLLKSKKRLPIRLKTTQFKVVDRVRGVTIYRHRDSTIVRYGAEAILPASPDRVRLALLNYRKQIVLLKRIKEARVLKRGKHWLVVYQRLGLPVISDRDFTLLVKWGREGAATWLSYWSVNDQGPPPSRGVIRVTHSLGTWQLIPMPDGHSTLARYQMSIDMAGQLPKWMARDNAGKELPDMLEAICHLSRPDRKPKDCIKRPDKNS